MKKILCNILALSMILGGLTACKVNNASNTDSSSSYQDSTQGGAGGSSDKEQDSTQSGSGGSAGEEEGGEQEQECIDIILGSYSSFEEGRAKVAYYENGEMRYALIDTQGNYLYDVPKSWEHIGKGAGYTYEKDENGDYVYEIINSQGEVVANSKEKGFEKVIGYGEGQVLVYQYKGTPTSVEYLYGIISGEDGSWIHPLRDAEIEHWSYEYDMYCGGGVFLSYNSMIRDYRMYNSNINQICYFTSHTKFAERKIFNDVLYGGDGYIGHYNEGVNSLPSYFALHTDGTYEEVEEFSAVSNGKIIRNIGKENAYVEIYDPITNKTIEYKDYPADMVQSIDFTQKYGLVILKGIDGTKYFTLIDNSGIQQFEPIACYGSVKYSDGKIVYASSKIQYTITGYTVVNEKGEKLIEGKNFGENYMIGAFANGIAVVSYKKANSSYERNYFYINEKGETVLTKMFKK